MWQKTNMSIIALRRPLVLATASPARRRLVADAGIDFIADSVDIDESPRAGESVGAYVERLAREKAEAVVPPALDAVVVTVDTAVGIGDEIIGKPRDEAHAREIIGKLSGAEHEVVSAIAIRDVGEASVETDVTRTVVRFVELSGRMIDWYISTGEWKGRAGAYGIQGKGASLVEEVRGCFTNVIGISMPALMRMLCRFSG